MITKTFAFSHQGKRENNEDSYEYRTEEAVWTLADGLGGHDCGEVASKEACRFAVDTYIGGDISFDDTGFMKLLNQTNRHVINLQHSSPELESMRTTFVFGAASEGVFRYANVGDSRLYYFKNGKIFAQSEDHSVSAIAAKLGEIKPEDIRFNVDRNRLTKAIGNSEELGLNVLPKPISISSGDAFIMCSDGFWEYVYETEMEIDLLKSDNPKTWATYMLKRLLIRTEKSEDNDNFTVLCNFFE